MSGNTNSDFHRELIISKIEQKDLHFLYNKILNHSFPELIYKLGTDLLNLTISELIKRFENETIQLYYLKLLKHKGNFDEFIKIYKRLPAKSFEALNTFLEYKIIIGEKVEDKFKSQIQEKKDFNSYKFIPNYAEYLWLFGEVEKTQDFINKHLVTGNDNEFLSKLKFIKAETLRHQGKYKEALILYDEVLKHLKNSFEVRYIALSYKSISVCYRNLNKWAKSLSFLNKAYGLSKNWGDKSLLARTTLSFGSFYEIRNMPEKALQFHKDALKLGKEMNSTRDKFYASMNIAITQIQLGLFEEAKETLKNSYLAAEKLDRSYYFDMWIGFINSYYLDDKSGIKLIRQSIKTAKLKNEPKRIDIANSLLGVAYSKMNTEKSERILSKLKIKTTSEVIKEGIDEFANGVEFHKSKLCS